MAAISLGIHNPGYWFYHHFWNLVDWVYPPSCAGCGKFGLRWCDECQSQTKLLTQSLCPRCGHPADQNIPCQQCQSHPINLDAVRSWASYSGPVREAIHTLKYRHDLGIAEVLAARLVEVFVGLGWLIDVVTVVPLSLNRLHERGFNQSNLLALPFSLATGLPFFPDATVRVRDTHSQVGLSAKERKANVQSAFMAKPERVSRKNVLLIDDVITTGSTLSACAEALFSAGASHVLGLTVARTMLDTTEDQTNGQDAAALAAA